MPLKFDTTLGRALNRRIRLLATTLRPATIKHYRQTVSGFLGYLKENFPSLRRPDQLRRDPHILGWIEFLAKRQPPLSPGTRLKRLCCIRRLLFELGDLPHPPRPGLIHSEDLPRCDFRLPRPLSPDDDRKLQQQLIEDNSLLANALMLLRGTGLRIGELADLAADCLQSLDADHWAIRVPIGKLHSERWVPVDNEIREILARLTFFRTYLRYPETTFLLPRPRGRDWLIGDLRRALHSAAAAAGCSIRPVPHQIRHTYATDMLRRGVSLIGVMKLLGHTTPRMTLCYIQITQADLQREFLQARQHPRHLLPLPIPPTSEPPSLTTALQYALAALDRRRLHDGYPCQLDPFRRRLLRLIHLIERIGEAN